MNICIFTKYLPIHVTGGMEVHAQDLIDGLRKKGHKLWVITSRHPENIKKDSKNNLEVYYLNSEAKHPRDKFYKESASCFENLNKKIGFDIAHSQSTAGYGYVRYCDNKTPLVLTSHGTAWNEIKTVLKGKSDLKHILVIPLWLRAHFLRDPKIYQQSRKIIAVSEELKNDLVKQYEIEPSKVKVIPNGVNIEKYKPKPKEELKKIKDKWNVKNKRVILSVGNLRKIKGYHLLVETMPQLLEEKDIQLFIVGEGQYLKDLKKLAKKLKVSDDVTFTEHISDEELIDLYNIADVFALPTLWHSEAFGIVNAEAMACETPVISSRIGGVPTVIDNYENGILIEPGNKKELKEKILEVLNNNELAERLGKAGREKVLKEFSTKKMVEETIKVYKKVLSRQ